MPKIDTLIGVFTKYWTPGRVKTRLAVDVGEDCAATLHRIFVETTLARVGGLADRSVLCFAPSERRPEFEAFRPTGWEVVPQSDGDLGRRMREFFQFAFLGGAQRVVVVGSDSPTVPTQHIAKAFELLGESSVVLGPSLDGGYYLVGASDCVPDIFEGIDWGTESVWRQTLDRLHAIGLHESRGFATLPPHRDIDTIDDLRAVRDQLADSPERSSPPLARLAAAIAKTDLGRALSD